MKKSILLLSILTIIGIFYIFVNIGTGSAVDGKSFNDRYLMIDKTPKGLDDYKQETLILHEKIKFWGIESVHSTITFENPISIEDTIKLIDEYKIKPVFVYAYSKSKEGDLITIGGKFKHGIAEGIKVVMETETEEEFLGIVALIAAVPTKYLYFLQDNQNVFLVDVSADEHITDNPQNKDYMQHFAWDLYHNKLKLETE